MLRDADEMLEFRRLRWRDKKCSLRSVKVRAFCLPALRCEMISILGCVRCTGLSFLEKLLEERDRKLIHCRLVADGWASVCHLQSLFRSRCEDLSCTSCIAAGFGEI